MIFEVNSNINQIENILLYWVIRLKLLNSKRNKNEIYEVRFLMHHSNHAI